MNVSMMDGWDGMGWDGINGSMDEYTDRHTLDIIFLSFK